jgi:FdhD protein
MPRHAEPGSASTPSFEPAASLNDNGSKLMDRPQNALNQRARTATSLAWRIGAVTQKQRLLPEETPVALTYNRMTFAVMMASPHDLRDFAIGFSLSEGIIENLSEIIDLEIVQADAGIECRMTLDAARGDVLDARRRRIAGPVGCGLCGIDSLEQAVLPAKRVDASIEIPATLIAESLARMEQQQALNKATHAVHAAAFVNASSGSLLLREDIGRHNALDKLIGAAAGQGEQGGDGMVLLTSRVSIDLIQKTAMFGAPVLVAVSVPSARAMREAESAGITLIGVARKDGFEIFSHRQRILL